jgi:hypothetical protein
VVTGIGTFNGRVILVGTSEPKLYRLDAPTGSTTVLSLPPGLSGNVRWPLMASPTVGFCLVNNDAFGTTNLTSWKKLSTPLAANLEAIDLDRAIDPVGLFAAGVAGAFYSRDLGASWLPTKGLPKRPQANHLEVVDNGPGGRWIHLGTWNWSAWRAKLG